MGVGERCVPARHPPRRRFQKQKCALANLRDHLGAETAGLGRLVHDHQTTGLLHAAGDRVHVDRPQGPEVDDLCVDALLTHFLRCGHGLEQHGAPGHDRDVLTLAHDLGLAEINDVFAVGHLCLQRPVGSLGLEEQHGIVVADGTGKQPLGIMGVTGADYLETRRVDEHRFG